MSDNEDLLGEDLGDHSLADYNLGNEEEEQLLADDYDTGAPQNVPSSHGPAYREPVSVVPNEFPSQAMEYSQPAHTAEAECVVPNITVEVPNVSHRPHSTYAPYEPPVYDESAVVPPPIPAAPMESPQIVPSEVPSVSNGEPGRNRFISERTGPVRTPQQRNIPDSLDKVIVPGGMPGAVRGRNSWRHPQYRAPHPYRRQNFRGNFSTRHSFPPPQRPPLDPQPELGPEIPQMGPEISPERPILPQDMPLMPLENRPFGQGPPRFPYRNEEPNFQNVRPNFERPMFYQRPAFNPRFAPPVREIAPPSLPQITIPAGIPMMPKGREPEVRMLPVQLPPNLPPGGLAGKKVLINPHFKGNFQPPIEGLPAYIPTRIQKTPPLSPTLESKFGPIKDIDDAAERFIAEQRNALARAAGRKYARRSPQRYIENTTIEIENDLARRDDDELLRRQEEFINANRAGLRRRMRSPTPPPRRSPSPRRARPPPPTHTHAPSDEDSEYRRRVREQENMRERVLRAKEVRRRKNAVALQKQLQDREKEQEKELTIEKARESPPKVKEEIKPTTTHEQDVKPDTTRNTPERSVKETPKQKEIEKPKEKEVEKVRERSPVSRKVESAEANSTCDGLTPPRETLTPPLDDDDLDLILGDIDGILSEDDEPTPQKPKPKNETKPAADLRSKLPPKIIKTTTTIEKKPQQRQKIVFNDDKDKKKKEKSPIRRTVSTISKNHDDDKEKASKSEKETEEKKQTFANRRVILQRKTNKEKIFRVEKTDPTRPHPGIFSRAVTAIVDVKNEPQVEYDSGSDDDNSPAGKKSPVAKHVALVTNLPHGMTDTRLTTLAGNEVQSLSLDKEERSAKITFKTASAAENFRKKFNNKMVAASRLTVNLK
ncbi:titin-like isoform X2 [Aricia agestis]|uniref:titin-like isoform X2 n=1 Tax=Aricia agestis TaxID=91739 RepID=UPI001C206FC3|nr:titin-like isoform X2 [Aricia agestis]